MPKFILPNQFIINSLKQVQIPISDIDDLLGLKSKSVALFLDYGSDDALYKTYSFYLTDSNSSSYIVQMLRFIKQKYRIDERTIDYKGRKDKQKQLAFKDWISIVRNYPGLLYVLCYDNKILQTDQYKSEIKIHKKELKELGFEGKAKTYEKMAIALSLVTIIAPYLREHNLAVITDPDDIINGEENFKIINTSLGLLLQNLTGFQNICSFLTKFEKTNENEVGNKHFEELLSIPDIACSSLSAYLNASENLKNLDVECQEIIGELANFVPVEDYKIENKLYCPLGISKFDLISHKNEKIQITHSSCKIEL